MEKVLPSSFYGTYSSKNFDIKAWAKKFDRVPSPQRSNDKDETTSY